VICHHYHFRWLEFRNGNRNGHVVEELLEAVAFECIREARRLEQMFYAIGVALISILPQIARALCRRASV
jgi:hypothetical protein